MREFICPECGSSYFGADGTTIWCHGQLIDHFRQTSSGCKFSGPIAEHMHKSIPPRLLRAQRLFNILIEKPRFDWLPLCPNSIEKALKALEDWETEDAKNI